MSYHHFICCLALCGGMAGAATLPDKIAGEIKGYQDSRNQIMQQAKQDYLDILTSLLKKYRESGQTDKAATVEAEIKRVNDLKPGEALSPERKTESSGNSFDKREPSKQ